MNSEANFRTADETGCGSLACLASRSMSAGIQGSTTYGYAWRVAIMPKTAACNFRSASGYFGSSRLGNFVLFASRANRSYHSHESDWAPTRKQCSRTLSVTTVSFSARLRSTPDNVLRLNVSFYPVAGNQIHSRSGGLSNFNVLITKTLDEGVKDLADERNRDAGKISEVPNRQNWNCFVSYAPGLSC